MVILAEIPEVLEDIKHGKPFILVDDSERENEGDIIYPAEGITPAQVNYILVNAKGFLCLSLGHEIYEPLKMKPLSVNNTSENGTPFSMPLDAKKKYGVTTGISSSDRAKTIQVILETSDIAEDLTEPGHVHILLADAKGTIARQGHTEAAVDFMRLAGKRPAAVICEVLAPDGEVLRMPYLAEFSSKEGMLVTSIEKMLEYIFISEKTSLLHMEYISKNGDISATTHRFNSANGEFFIDITLANEHSAPDASHGNHLAVEIFSFATEDPEALNADAGSYLKNLPSLEKNCTRIVIFGKRDPLEEIFNQQAQPSKRVITIGSIYLALKFLKIDAIIVREEDILTKILQERFNLKILKQQEISPRNLS